MEDKRAKESGQLLVEASVATGIIVILVVSVVTLSLRALNQNRLVSDQVIATNLAAEGYEIAKNILDGNAYKRRAWNDGFSTGEYEVNYLSPSLGDKINIEDARFISLNNATQTYEYGAEVRTPFKRVIKVDVIDVNNQINITSTVIWTTPKNPGGETVSVSGALLGWR